MVVRGRVEPASMSSFRGGLDRLSRSRRSIGREGLLVDWSRSVLTSARRVPILRFSERVATLVARARDWTGGELPEVVVEATGVKEPMRLALDFGGGGGRVVSSGSGHEVLCGSVPCLSRVDVLVGCWQAEFALR